MVKLYYLAVVWRPPEGGSAKTLKAASDLASFGFFQRGSVGEFMKFTSKMVVERSARATRTSVKEQEYMCHVYVRGDGLSGVLVSDQEYPNRVAHSLINRLLDEFAAAVHPTTWPSIPEGQAQFGALEPRLHQWQDPKQADSMTRLEADLDETKIILHGTISSLLERGEKLDDLVAKSEDLSANSKMFYKTARKTNQCCTYI